MPRLGDDPDDDVRATARATLALVERRWTACPAGSSLYRRHLGLGDLVDAHRFDARDEDSLADAGPLLARLGRNPQFLADLAIDELKHRCVGQVAANSYGAQVLLLRPPNGRYVLLASDIARLRRGDAAYRKGDRLSPRRGVGRRA